MNTNHYGQTANPYANMYGGPQHASAMGHQINQGINLDASSHRQNGVWQQNNNWMAAPSGPMMSSGAAAASQNLQHMPQGLVAMGMNSQSAALAAQQAAAISMQEKYQKASLLLEEIRRENLPTKFTNVRECNDAQRLV